MQAGRSHLHIYHKVGPIVALWALTALQVGVYA